MYLRFITNVLFMNQETIQSNYVEILFLKYNKNEIYYKSILKKLKKRRLQIQDYQFYLVKKIILKLKLNKKQKTNKIKIRKFRIKI